MDRRLVVVGAGIAGVRTIESARAAGFTGAITLIGDELHMPYERPPLSKQVLGGKWEERHVFPRTDEELAALDVEFRLHTKVTRLDRKSKVVEIQGGEEVPYDTLVIATGSHARTLPFDHPDGVYTIRTLEDSLAIADELKQRPRVAVIGAGFIGLEVASTARSLGCQVTLIESGRVPLVRALGQTLGVHCAALHESHGVEVLTRGRVIGFTSDERVTGVVLDDRVLPVDLVIVGVGAIPNVSWLADSGLDTSNGLQCDAHGRADATGDVYGVGDASSWWNELAGRHIRHEHWTSATEQAVHVGRLIAGHELPGHASIPYFWSDQYGLKIQMAGAAAVDDELTVVDGSLASGRFVAAYSHLDGQLTAVVGFDAPRPFAMHRGLLTRGGSLEDARALAARISGVPIPAA